MHKPGGRDSSCLKDQGVQYPEVSRSISSSPLEEGDTDISSLIEDNPMTILCISEKLDIPFIDCLLRTRRLWRMGLLERIDAEPDSVGLYRYSVPAKHE